MVYIQASCVQASWSAQHSAIDAERVSIEFNRDVVLGQLRQLGVDTKNERLIEMISTKVALAWYSIDQPNPPTTTTCGHDCNHIHHCTPCTCLAAAELKSSGPLPPYVPSLLGVLAVMSTILSIYPGLPIRLFTSSCTVIGTLMMTTMIPVAVAELLMMMMQMTFCLTLLPWFLSVRSRRQHHLCTSLQAWM